MENVIKKIFSGKTDAEIHNDFVKFSRGIFENRYLLEGKKQKDKYSIKTGPEFVNFLVRKCLEKTGNEVAIKGAIISTLDLNKDISFPIENVKKFMGIKQNVINTTADKKKILDLMDKYPKAFYALSFSGNNFDLKIKAKAPKSAKPSSSGDKEPAAEFCSLKTQDEELVKDLFFDISGFTEVKIKHVINIDKITLPSGEKDPVKIRELSKREGIVKRISNVDGKENIKEAKFFA